MWLHQSSCKTNGVAQVSDASVALLYLSFILKPAHGSLPDYPSSKHPTTAIAQQLVLKHKAPCLTSS